ncbi:MULTISPECIES: type II toxin-antitoxin system prevent-host-death family antitoxin [Streptomyces]|uniref:type II toxin-antitoxin system prevent-host-death family antitoxin n=1 Tax=Streptomyces TaxID=1883 RepID=UPI00099FE711|nr:MULTISPECIES: type II toxin-antitoxin system prevent-host-death family antitoxin [unclassified Streptomyces]MCP3766808.1 type II toxin-antitoxin system Phd/YefM family antitoxin [Streptomyces sp. MAR25Y5]
MTQPLPVESFRDVRAHAAEAVERADRDDVPTVITRRGKQAAAVVSIEVPPKSREREEREVNRVIDERLAGAVSAQVRRGGRRGGRMCGDVRGERGPRP